MPPCASALFEPGVPDASQKKAPWRERSLNAILCDLRRQAAHLRRSGIALPSARRDQHSGRDVHLVLEGRSLHIHRPARLLGGERRSWRG